ncbi:MAG: type III secretion system chaperone [Desulfovibrionaceae bacterium]|nr:type III secretion system chaperone [Desulfovibrionaceae bacterium]
MDNAHIFLKRLGTDINNPALAFDDAGTAVLEFDGTYSVTLQLMAEWDAIYMFTEVGTLPDEALGEKAVQLLSANLFGIQTGGGVLALEPTSNTVVFSKIVYLSSAEYELQYQQVEHFLHFAEFWRSTLHSEQVAVMPEGTEVLTIPPEMQMIRV